MVYQFYGSKTSVDIDVAFFIEKLPESIFDRAALCKEYCNKLKTLTPFDKRINGNLVVVSEGYLIATYKGSIDELNNALFTTYILHDQHFENQIKISLERDADLKFIRCTRMILSVLTRTSYRTEIKAALSDDIHKRLETLKTINLSIISETTKRYNLIDIRKLIAFQLGQTMALDDGIEVYTKEDIVSIYPDLQKYLLRDGVADSKALQNYLEIFSIKLEYRLKNITRKDEYEYKIRKPI